MNRAAWVFFGLVAVAVVALASLTSFLILPHLAFGWIRYLARVLPEVEVRWYGLCAFVVATVIFGLVLHAIARWLRSEMSGHQSRWRWRSTGMVVGILLMMFVAGIAMVGITHQSYWLLSDDRELGVSTIPGGHATNKNNLRMLGLAVLVSQDVRRSNFDVSEPRRSWATQALPYAVYWHGLDLNLPWDHPANRSQASKLAPVLLNPELVPVVLRDENGYGVSHYAANCWVFDENERLVLSDSDETKSKTLLIGEVNANFQPWAKPNSTRDPLLGISRSPDGFGGPPSRGGAYFSMGDGSVKYLSNDTDPAVLRALSGKQDEDE